MDGRAQRQEGGDGVPGVGGGAGVGDDDACELGGRVEWRRCTVRGRCTERGRHAERRAQHGALPRQAEHAQVEQALTRD
eukprot:5754206-Pleurochrysis_carterae.AAC.5